MSDRLRYWIFRITSALRWYRRAGTRYDVHSPFLSGFIREVYHDDREYHAFGVVQAVRAFWGGQQERIGLQQLGAPSRTTTATERSAASLVSTNAINDRCGRFLFRLALWSRPARIIELGTNAGLSTLYLHLADTRTPLYTVEGNAAVAALARTSFGQAAASTRLHAYTATFADWLEGELPTGPERLLTFIDGDHRYQPTLDYVNRLLETATNESVIVVADIHWSAGMERAWTELLGHPRVTASVDVYHFGLLFLRPELRGPHLSLIRTRFKPWRVGFF